MQHLLCPVAVAQGGYFTCDVLVHEMFSRVKQQCKSMMNKLNA